MLEQIFNLRMSLHQSYYRRKLCKKINEGRGYREKEITFHNT